MDAEDADGKIDIRIGELDFECLCSQIFPGLFVWLMLSFGNAKRNRAE